MEVPLGTHQLDSRIALSRRVPRRAGRRAAGPAREACGSREFSYAGLQSNEAAHGIRATIAPLAAPDVPDGHVGGWIGVGGTQAGPRGTAEWLQTGYASMAPESTIYIYYEVTVTGKEPAYHEVKADVKPGEKHDFAVLEVRGRNSWWRVWVDGKPVTKPIHLPGSHSDWYPQALAENWNGNAGTLQLLRVPLLERQARAAERRLLAVAQGPARCSRIPATRSCRPRGSRATSSRRACSRGAARS